MLKILNTGIPGIHIFTNAFVQWKTKCFLHVICGYGLDYTLDYTIHKTMEIL